ncbi:MAG: class I SAM-dependent methyltransferase [Bacteroidales bacterium]|nr:class I SAM-dependent methyltransferase [Bacteroidales bacterium]
MAKTKPFDEHLNEYEQWFSDNQYAFESELEAIRKVLPKKGKGIEIGIGSGVFAVPLGIMEGVEPSKSMRDKAEERGLHVIDGIAENLPVADKSYDFALMVTTICFVDDISRSFAEAYRILKENGVLILGFVDKESPVGKLYLSFKDKSLFYKDATFYSTEEVYKVLWENDFTIINTRQTVFGHLNQINEIQKPEKGYGKGSFIVVKANKTNLKISK